MHAEVQDIERTLIDTTVGRVLFNRALPEVVPFINGNLKKRGLSDFVNYVYLTFGEELCVLMLDDLKDLGFIRRDPRRDLDRRRRHARAGEKRGVHCRRPQARSSRSRASATPA